MKKIIIWTVLSLITLALFYLIFKLVNRPLPGEAVLDQGRDHVTDIAGVDYNSNPPTSGPHFPVWAKKGAYDRLISDGYLIHSLEHGYIVISYDCSEPVTNHRSPVTVYAHDGLAKESTDSGQLLKHMKIQPTSTMSWFTPENPPEVEIELPESFQSQSCKDLIGKLSEFTKVAERVIVTPRVGMDSPIAVTAWGRILKLQSFDEAKIKEFIRNFHNRGPEQTDE